MNKENTKQCHINKWENCVFRTHYWIGMMEDVLHAANCLLDTGVQLHIVGRSFLSDSWMEGVNDEHILNFCSAMNDAIITFRQNELYLKPGDLRAKKIFLVVEKLSVSILIETYIKDKYFTCIYPTERQLNHLSSRQIAFLSTEASNKQVIATASVQQEGERRVSNKIGEKAIEPAIKLKVTKQNSFQPSGMQNVLDVSKEQGLMYFEQLEQSARREQLLSAKRIMEFLTKNPF